jgi:hypothetical protein
MNNLQLSYLDKIRTAIENYAGDDEMQYILNNMRQDLSEEEYKAVLETLKNSKS